jgi:hypothetical protein
VKRPTAILLLALSAPFLLLACSDDDDNPVAPVEEGPPPEVFTETFDGTLEMGGISCHDFTTVAAGTAEMMITDLQPLTTLTVGVQIGTTEESAENGCLAFARDSSVRVDETLAAQDLEDVGNIFEGQTVTYTVQVSHT